MRCVCRSLILSILNNSAPSVNEATGHERRICGGDSVGICKCPFLLNDVIRPRVMSQL